MNLKEAFRFQNKLQGLMNEAQSILQDDRNITKTQTTIFHKKVMPELDILYMTRVQKERFTDEAEYERVKNCFVLDAERMKLAKERMAVLHPLPRVNEITREVDADPRAAYFRQVENGKFVRMALILSLMRWKGEQMVERHEKGEIDGLRCPNHKCITNNEPMERYFYTADNGVHRCYYCDTKAE